MIRPRPQPIVNALTIDVEDYFHVTAFARWIDPSSWGEFEQRIEIGLRRILDHLAAADVRATFFVLGWVARRRPRLVRAIVAAGHDIASHGDRHQLVTAQSRADFRADVRAARAVLEDVVGQPVTAYRAPSFSIAPDRAWAFEVLVEEGYTIDSSVAVGRRQSCGHLAGSKVPFRLETRAGALWEYPLPAVRVFGRSVPVGGGGYFRLFPYAWTRAALARINSVGKPFAVYLHPWEFDPDQPALSGPWLRRWRHRVNLRRTEPRFVRLLADFRFAPLAESLREFTAKSSPPAAMPALS